MKLLYVVVAAVFIFYRSSEGRNLRELSAKPSGVDEEADAFSTELAGSVDPQVFIPRNDPFAEGGDYHPEVLRYLERELRKLAENVKSKRARICTQIPRPFCV